MKKSKFLQIFLLFFLGGCGDSPEDAPISKRDPKKRFQSQEERSVVQDQKSIRLEPESAPEESSDKEEQSDSLSSELKNQLLHQAVLDGDFKKVKELVESGAHVNNLNEFGDRPLHDSVFSTSALAIIQFLVNEGAVVNVKNKKGETPLHKACSLAKDLNEYHFEIVKLLIAFGARINVRDEFGMTPLHYAAFQENIDVVQYLILKGANPHVTDQDGDTPLDLAETYYSDNQELIQLLSQ